MIYVRKYCLYDDKYSITKDRLVLTSELNSALDFIGNSLTEIYPLAYLKDLNSNNLIEIKLIDNQIVLSYILDLFNFEEEFK